MNNKFNKNEAAHEIVILNITHKHALKMAVLICISIISIITIGGLFFGKLTPIGIGVLLIVGIIFGIISGLMTRSALL